MITQRVPVERHGAGDHRPIEVDIHAAAITRLRQLKPLAIGADKLVFGVIEVVVRQDDIGMWQSYVLEVAVGAVGGGVFGQVQPAIIEVEYTSHRRILTVCRAGQEAGIITRHAR